MTKDERQKIMNLLEAAKQVGGEKLKIDIWRLLPEDTRMHFNWGQYHKKP